VMGENPVRAFPDSPRIEKALSALDFLVVQDLFLTETARLAHAVLPACSFAEKDGTFTNIERRVQRIRKAFEPLQQSRPDWEILCDLSKRLGYPMECNSAEEITQEITSLVPSYAGITLARLERGGVFWPCPENGSEVKSRLSVQEWGPEKSALIPTPLEAGLQSRETTKEDAFVLVRGSTLYHFLGGTRSTRSSRLKTIKTAGSVEMNPYDAYELGLKEGDSVTLYNNKAAVPMALVLSESLPRGMLFCPYFDQSSSALVSFSSDGTGVDACQVQIRKES
jgi:predicted molibdopterin-dependent oxidoreductase YjgC